MKNFIPTKFIFFKSFCFVLLFITSNIVTSQVFSEDCGALTTLYQTIKIDNEIHIIKYNKYNKEFDDIGILEGSNGPAATASAYSSKTGYIYTFKNQGVPNVVNVYDIVNPTKEVKGIKYYGIVGSITLEGLGNNVLANQDMFAIDDKIGFRSDGGSKLITFKVDDVSSYPASVQVKMIDIKSADRNNQNQIVSHICSDYVAYKGKVYGVVNITADGIERGVCGMIVIDPSNENPNNTTNPNIKRINLTLNNILYDSDNKTVIDNIPPKPGAWGAVWVDRGGNFLAFNNGTGRIYKIKLSLLENNIGNNLVFNKYLISNPSSSNDGFGCQFKPKFGDNDKDGYTDDIDLDDDNDGILDTVESGGVDPWADDNLDDISNLKDETYIHPIWGAFVDMDGDGINDIFDTDNDGIINSFDLDSDNDGCYDTPEAGLDDDDYDGILGTSLPEYINSGNVEVDDDGKVINQPDNHYTTTETGYVNVITIGHPSEIQDQPQNTPTLNIGDTATFNFTLKTIGSGITSYQWRVSTDGLIWTDIAGEINPTLNVTGVTCAMSGNQYRVFISQSDYACGILSDPATLNVDKPAPPTTTPLIICYSDVKKVSDLIATGSDIKWYSSLKGGITYSGTENLVSGTYYASQTIANCESDRNAALVTVTQAPNAGTDGILTVCQGTSPTEAELFSSLGAPKDGGGTWSNVGLVYTYTVQATSPCTEPDTATVEVTEQALPNAGTDGVIIICKDTLPTEDDLFASLGGNPDQGGTWSNEGLVYTYTVQATWPCTLEDKAIVVGNDTDNVPPTIICSDDVLVNTYVLFESPTVVLVPPVATDNCKVISLTNDHPSTIFAEGTTPVVWTAIDNSGNSSTCIQNVVVEFIERPTIALIKTGKFNDENKDGYAQENETISYNFKVVNTGNVPLTDVTITDPLPGVDMKIGSISLGVGESNSDFFTATYSINKEDIIMELVSNQATAFGTSPKGVEVSDKSDDLNELGDNPTIIPDLIAPVKVYNALTADNNGINDFFYIEGLEYYPNNTVQIFNRWGVLVFERAHYNNADQSFTGVSEGRLTMEGADRLPAGTYFYILNYTNVKSKNFKKSGFIDLRYQ